MYLFMTPKNYNLFKYGHVLEPPKNLSQHNIYRTLDIIKKLGGKVYRVDRNYFTKNPKLNTTGKMLLESH